MWTKFERVAHHGQGAIRKIRGRRGRSNSTQSRGTTRRKVIATTGAALFSIGALGVAAYAATSTQTSSGIVSNPGWPTKCNPNIALLLDRSASIGVRYYGGSPSNVNALKAAAINFVNTLGGKEDGPRLYVNTFAKNIKPLYQLWGGGYADIPATTNPYTGGSVDKAAFNIYTAPFAQSTSTTTDDADYSDYGAGPNRGATNWQGAMDAVPTGADLVVMITDGDPTWRTDADPTKNDGGTMDTEDGLYAIAAANTLKQNGARVVGVHVGQKNTGWNERLAAISGPTLNSDYFGTDYTNLSTVLQNIAGQTCRASMALSPASVTVEQGQNFTLTYRVKNLGTVPLHDIKIWDSKFRPRGGSLGPVKIVATEYDLTQDASITVLNDWSVNDVGTFEMFAQACGLTPDNRTVCVYSNGITVTIKTATTTTTTTTTATTPPTTTTAPVTTTTTTTSTVPPIIAT